MLQGALTVYGGSDRVSSLSVPENVRGKEAADSFCAFWLGKRLTALKQAQVSVLLVSRDAFFDDLADVLVACGLPARRWKELTEALDGKKSRPALQL